MGFRRLKKKKKSGSALCTQHRHTLSQASRTQCYSRNTFHAQTAGKFDKDPCCSKSFILAQGKTYKTMFCSCQTMLVSSHFLPAFCCSVSPAHLHVSRLRISGTHRDIETNGTLGAPLLPCLIKLFPVLFAIFSLQMTLKQTPQKHAVLFVQQRRNHRGSYAQ